MFSDNERKAGELYAEYTISFMLARQNLSALRRKRDGILLPRILSQRLAPGVGAGNVR
jgi:hypothetical protein